MDKTQIDLLLNQNIDTLIQSLIPNGSGPVTEPRLRWALETIAKEAFSAGGSYQLSNILTVDDIATRFGVSLRRAKALAMDRHERFGIGRKIGATNVYVFSIDDLPALSPGPSHRPKKIK
jgi:hypothetical protein